MPGGFRSESTEERVPFGDRQTLNDALKKSIANINEG
jgi:hypothetical protein